MARLSHHHKGVQLYRHLISKNLLEDMVLGLQQDKLKSTNVVISSENSAVQT